MNISSLILNKHRISAEQNDDINTVVAITVAHVVQNYITQLSQSFVLTLCCYDEDICDFYNTLLEKLFYIWGAPLLQLVVVRKPLQHTPGSRNFNMILVDSFQAFADINIAAYTALNNNNEFYYILLKIFRHDLAFHHMQKIFEYCWYNQLINCNVQLQNAMGEILVYTFFPFTSEQCGHIEPVVINRFNGSYFESPEMFPHKLRNFNGCSLRAAVWDVPPYLALETNDKGMSTVVGGFEGNLLLALANKLNFTIDVKTPPNGEQRGIFINNEWTGALGMLNKRTVDLSLGCFRQTADRDSNASSIHNFYLSGHIVCIPKAAYRFTPIEILLHPFQTSIWLLIIFVLGFGFLALSFLNKYHRIKSSYSLLNLLLISFGMPISMRSAGFRLRLFWATWIFFTLILRAVYQSLLFHIIRTRATHSMPDNFDELVSKGYTIFINKITYESLKDVPVLMKLKRHILESSLDMVAFESVAKEPRRDIAALGSSDFLYYFMRSKEKAGIFKILKQKVVTLQTTIYFTKHSYLIDEFQNQILWIRAAGLIDAWTRWELHDNRVDFQRFEDDELQRVRVIYILIIIGVYGFSLATIVFLLEILSNRYVALQKVFSKV